MRSNEQCGHRAGRRASARSATRLRIGSLGNATRHVGHFALPLDKTFLEALGAEQMAISTLVDLVVRRAQADGAVVVALSGGRVVICAVARQRSFWVHCVCGCGTLCRPDFAPASTRPAFFMTDASLPDPESGEPHRYRPASEALVLASVLLVASYSRLSGLWRWSA